MTGADYRIAIGHLITELRQNKHLTQADLAELLGTSQSAINRIERGAQNVSLDILAKLSDVLDSDIILLSNPNRLSLKITGGCTLSGQINATHLSEFQALALEVLNRTTGSSIELSSVKTTDSHIQEVLNGTRSVTSVKPYISPIFYQLLSLLNRSSYSEPTIEYSDSIPENSIIYVVRMLATAGTSYLIDAANTNRQYNEIYDQLKYCGAQIEIYHEI